MSLAPSIEILADRAAEKLRESTDKSRERFFIILTEVVRGAGISSQQLPDYRKRLQGELSKRSARHRSAAATARKNRRKAS